MCIRDRYRSAILRLDAQIFEFDFITGEYIGEAVGFPRTRSYGKRNAPPIIKKPSSKANVCITNMCKDRGFDSRKKTELVSKFLQNKGYEPVSYTHLPDPWNYFLG